jgi:DNA-directed RNA polymerase subunit M/transcription elongation factor TFIIS
MFFCPTCANLLLVAQDAERGYHFACPTCTYRGTLTRRIERTSELSLKRVDEIRGGKAEWEAVPKTQGTVLALFYFGSSLVGTNYMLG